MKARPFHGLTFQTGVPGAQPSPAQPSRSITATRPTSNTPARGREAGKMEETFSCLSLARLLVTGSHPETGRPGQRAAHVHPAPDRCPPTRQAAGAALTPSSRQRRWEGLPSFPSHLMLQRRSQSRVKNPPMSSPTPAQVRGTLSREDPSPHLGGNHWCGVGGDGCMGGNHRAAGRWERGPPGKRPATGSPRLPQDRLWEQEQRVSRWPAG